MSVGTSGAEIDDVATLRRVLDVNKVHFTLAACPDAGRLVDAGAPLAFIPRRILSELPFATEREFDVRVEGQDTVVVWSDEVPAPQHVRYAWADNPDFANLANQEGLPAAPFRTDRD